MHTTARSSGMYCVAPNAGNMGPSQLNGKTWFLHQPNRGRDRGGSSVPEPTPALNPVLDLTSNLILFLFFLYTLLNCYILLHTKQYYGE
jgi:hypothetical protein